MIETDIHWLRPAWLWGLVLWLIVVLWQWRQRHLRNAWHRIVDPVLQPFVLEGEERRSGLGRLALLGAWLLTVIMLAGPVWERQAVPVFEALQAEVIVLDLSASMLVDDVPPDRLTRARFKLSDLLSDSDGRQTGLIAFTERPYVISPLTDDTNTIEAFLPSLDPRMMPVQGSRLDLAIERAVTLLAQASVSEGHILYVGDQPVQARDLAAARQAREAGHRLSVLAVGTPAGKPLRDENGQFVVDNRGRIVVPGVRLAQMQEMAQAGGGIAVELSASDADLQQLAAVRQSIAIDSARDETEEAAQRLYWVEYSPWMVWLLLFMALLLFRRGVTTP